ncbi:DUF305 domain-containing protein [Streptomyces dysideae]|uniref:DUF305 domain-containing protein n=1 Tax=Streptomyces dysideae TaxID=909626 RepID=A0A117RY65_9ACTN|nr:DUF305 domain-containing protein [Streptomyces dysideae]KUO16222.1 hypothetical protein AQJ91_36980 [Streptomyces dysideae]
MSTGITRRTPVLITVGIVVVLAAALLVGWRAVEGTANAATPGDRSVEAGFSRDMAVHHQQAVEMSFIVRDRTDDEAVRTLAYDVINTQANQRGMLLGWLESWGLNKTSTRAPMTWMGHGAMYEAKDGSLMPGMATNTQLDQLRKATGKDAEILYLRLMTAHHQGGIDMARGAVKTAGDDKLVRLARTMVDGQRAEIDLMADMLAQRGAEAGQ